MKTRIIGLETEYALLHYSDERVQAKPLTGTELFEMMNSAMDEAGIVRLYEEKFYPESRGEPLSSYEDRRRYSLKKNRMFLANGARFYLDTGDHPEYATPECRSPFDVVAHDKAGERIVEDLSRRAESRLAAEGIPGRIVICKNNIDMRGNTFGCHENFLIPRRSTRHNESSFFKLVIRELIPFLISRQVICGAGKVVTGNKLGFQVSQRADFIDSELSSDTTFRRGIVNSRDEPLSKIDKWRRLHILVGDSNMSELATYLKLGTASLVLRVIEEQGLGEELVIEDPILALREISHDPQCRIKVKLVNGTYLSPIKIQQFYLDKVKAFLDGAGELNDPLNADIIGHWERVLGALESDPISLRSQIDWVGKKWLTDRFLARKGDSYTNLNKWVYVIKRLKSLRLAESLMLNRRRNGDFDVEDFLKHRVSQGDFIELKRHARYSEIDFNDYFRASAHYHSLLKMDILFHEIRTDRGLYYRMRQRGLGDAFALDGFGQAVEAALTRPPSNTRAKIRGDFIKLIAGTRVKGSVNWDSLTVHDVKLRKINLLNPFNSSSKNVKALFSELEALLSLGGSR